LLKQLGNPLSRAEKCTFQTREKSCRICKEKIKIGEDRMPVYNKLVRDKIPQIIEQTGKTFTTRILEDDEYRKELRKKAFEELEEYMNASDNETALEELADVLEIIHALAECHGGTIERVEQIRAEKAEKRGGFKEKIFLVEVHDE
jgi:predicted house-cleaning noncanonical NTP pyrophosphatase (MazG superfamily)